MDRKVSFKLAAISSITNSILALEVKFELQGISKFQPQTKSTPSLQEQIEIIKHKMKGIGFKEPMEYKHKIKFYKYEKFKIF